MADSARSPLENVEAGPPRAGVRASFGVFVILLASYAYFWHSRDWNTASRLMLTYSLGDRGSLAINGLHTQTLDMAFHEGSFYTDKQPGFSFLALPGYLALRLLFRFPPHPLDVPAMTHWPADYWLTLGTSGLLTAVTGALLTWTAMRLGCGPRRGALVGLAYGLCTPAYAYATLAYGHQAAATMLLASILIVALGAPAKGFVAPLSAGMLASYAGTIDLSVGPIAALIALIAAVRVVRREWSPGQFVLFVVGASVPLLFFLVYNTLAYGSPWEMGYSHHVLVQFRAVHSRRNPLGLTLPDWSRAARLLFGEYRGLFVYAPVLILAPIGWITLARRRRWALFGGTLGSCLLVFWVNFSYPEWTGGWCTGPRLLTVLLPFGVLAAAAALGQSCRRAWVPATAVATVLAVFGYVINTACQGVGARLPHEVDGMPLEHPLTGVVVPLWTGEPVPAWWVGTRFARNLFGLAMPGIVEAIEREPGRAWLQFAPLIVGQIVASAALIWLLRPSKHAE